jgi:hypothetical protein
MQTGEWVEVSVSSPYNLEQRANAGAPDAMVSVRLTTTRGRLKSDRAAFGLFTAHVYLCAAQWRVSSGKTFWVGAWPGRPECPSDASW